MNEKLHEIKSILNSLVVPNPDGLSLRHLCNDYREVEGEMIPFEALGFSSVTALIKSMPDSIRMVGNLQDINSVTLYPVKSENNAHIIGLVQGQAKHRKKSSKRPSLPRFSSGWNRSPTVGRRPCLKPTPFRTNNVYNQNINYNRNQPLLQNGSAFKSFNPLMSSTNGGYTPKTVIDHSKTNTTSLGEKFLNLRITKTLNKINEQTSRPGITRSTTDSIQTPLITYNTSNGCVLPNDIKDKIRVMMSSPDIEEGFMLFNFEARYRHQFKESFNYKSYGFETLIDCLKSLPDVLEMIPTGTKTFKLMPIRNNSIKFSSQQLNNVSISLANTSLANTSVPNTTNVISNGHSVPILTTTATPTNMKFVTTHSTRTTSTVSTTPKMAFTIPASKSAKVINTPPINAVNTANIVNSSPSAPLMSLKSAVPESIGENPSDNRSVCSSASNDSNINNRAKQNFRTILLFHENGINALDFAAEYLKYFKVAFDSRIWGFQSAMELFHGLPQVFAIEVNDRNEEILHDSRFKKFDKPKPTYKQDPNSIFIFKQIPDLIIGRIMRLIKNRSPIGLSVDNFVQIYDSLFDSIEATLNKLRISDSNHLFDVIKDDLPIVVKRIDGQNQAFVKSKDELSEWIVRQTRAFKYVIPITLVDTPSNIVVPGQSYRPIQLPERFKPGNYEYVAVYISSAVNPHEIYIQFKGTEYHTALETLMFGLDFYESAPTNEWTVPYEFLYVGYPVVCRYPGDKNWHRARISRIHTNDKRVVTVAFVDYGGTHVCDYQNLRLMKKEFLSLPVQALRVGLYGITPILGDRASDWTGSARDKLLRFSKPHYALACTLIERKPDNHLVAICDTNTESDVFLHIVLVNDKHALMSEDSPIPQSNGF